MAKVETGHVSFVYRQHPQLKLVNKFGNLSSCKNERYEVYIYSYELR